jgi:hypothetical protein
VPFTVSATRQNGFDGDIALTLDGLPPDVRLIGTPLISKGQNATTLLATVEAGVPPSAALPLRVTGTAMVDKNTLVRRAESRERNYVKNNDKVEETTRPVPLALVAVVTGPPDLIVTTGAERFTLSVGKTAELTVSVQRKTGFTAKIPLIVQGLPTGVSVTGAEIPENKNEATLTFKAESNAAVGEAMITILGRSVVDELHFSDHAAAPIALTIAKEDPAQPTTRAVYER